MHIQLVAIHPDLLSTRISLELRRLGHKVDPFYRGHTTLPPKAGQHDLTLYLPLTQLPDPSRHTELCWYLQLHAADGSSEWHTNSFQGPSLLTLWFMSPAYPQGRPGPSLPIPARMASWRSLLRREVSAATLQLLRTALERPSDGIINKPNGRQCPALHPNSNALPTQPLPVDWQTDATSTVLAKLLQADGGVPLSEELEGCAVELYGLRAADTQLAASGRMGQAGEIIGSHEDAICRATQDSALWIRQIRCLDHPRIPPLKLPATRVCAAVLPGEHLRPRAMRLSRRPAEDIRIQREGPIAKLYFDFYNGAIDTRHCQALRSQLSAIKQSNLRILILMGGEDHFCTGIHLGTIEAAADSPLEAWHNIEALNAVIRELIDTPDQLTLAALRAPARAGGLMLALACDQVFAREGTLLSPHFGATAHFGSAYRSYLLPARTGLDAALGLLGHTQPLLAGEAQGLGLVDAVFPEDWVTYERELDTLCTAFLEPTTFGRLIKRKQLRRMRDEAHKPLGEYRREELEALRPALFDPHSHFHGARRHYVYKTLPPERH